MINFEIFKDRSIIKVLGEDALKFLQNYTTNDLVKLRYSYNYMLNNQGRYLFDFFIYKDVTNSNQISFYIDIAKSSVESFVSKLKIYKLRADVKLEDISSEFDLVYAKCSLDEQLCLGYLESISQDFIYYEKDPRCSKLGYNILIKKGYKFDNNHMTLSRNLYLSDKYDYTIIDGAYDLRVEKSIPVEFAGEELNALSFTKGCYVGQEVISRAKHQGVIRKKIYQVKGNILNLLDEYDGERKLELLNEDNKKIGSLLSWWSGIGIAQIREEELLTLKSQRLFLDKEALNMIELNKVIEGDDNQGYDLAVDNPVWR